MRRVVIQRESSGRAVRVRAASNPRPSGAVECSGCGALYKSAAYAQAHVNKCLFLDSHRPRGSMLRTPRSGRKPSRNAIMMTIGHANPGARRPSHNKSTKAFKEYTLPIGQVKMTPKLQEAIERWEMFQDGAKAKKVRIYEYDDGKDGVDERVCFRVGESQITIDTVEDVNGNEVKIKPLDIGMVYKGEKAAPNKKGAQWVHSYTEDGGKPPVAVVDVETGVLMHLGGTYEALDWMRR